jgi:Zn-finger domain-containing protein
MKKHSGKRFKEITKSLREEGKKRKEKKNNERKWMQGDDG